jgi:hypothetical protein
MGKHERDKNLLYSLIPLEDFKALMGVDDRESYYFASMRNNSSEFLHSKNSKALLQPPSLAAYCLVTSTFAIEQYCKRKLIKNCIPIISLFWGIYFLH